MLGRVEKYLLEKIAAEKTIHMTLIDPEKITPAQAAEVAENCKRIGTAAIMIGGSTFDSQEHLDAVIQAIKNAVDLPIILFPNNVSGISKHSDAIWFMSLMNSVDPYFLVGDTIFRSQDAFLENFRHFILIGQPFNATQHLGSRNTQRRAS